MDSKTRFIDHQGSQIVLSGAWVLDNATVIETSITATDGDDGTIVAKIDRLDTAGAGLIQDLAMRCHVALNAIQGLTDAQKELLSLVEKAPPVNTERNHIHSGFSHSITDLGRGTFEAKKSLIDLLTFIGETTVWVGRLFRHPAQLRITSLTRHIRETGVNAIPIVALIAFLISVVLAYQGSNQLQRFGAQIFTVNLVGISVLREMGVLLTAIMVAGRSGSAFTAEIGVMKVNEEVDAMRIIGVEPFSFLVMPRLIALVIAMPLLAFIADMMGLLGGGLVSSWVLHISPEAYLDRIHTAVKMWDFWVGMIKAPVFGFVIAVVGCMRGLQVTGSAESVGKLTTVSVVQSIFLVLLLDALFSILFTQIGI